MREIPPGRPLFMTAGAFRDNGRALGALAALSVLLFLITAATYSSLGIVLPDMVREMHWNWAEAGFGFTLLGVRLWRIVMAAAHPDPAAGRRRPP